MELEKLRTINEINIQSLQKMNTELRRVRVTKAWKFMILLRRINEQLIKGSLVEKKSFFRWIKNKLLKRVYSQDIELAHFSPIHEAVIHDLDLSKIIAAGKVDSPNKALIDFGQYDYIEYSVPTKVDIFRFPVIDWDFRWQRPQQLSGQLGKNGFRVFYFSVEMNDLNIENASFEEVADNVRIRKLQNNVWGVQLATKNRLNVYKDNLIDPMDIQYLMDSIKYLKGKFQISETVTILDLPFWAPIAFELDNNKVIYDCMDDHAGFANNSALMLQSEEQVIRNSYAVITSSDRLANKVKDLNSNTLLIRNAGEFDHFSNKPESLAEQLIQINGPIIGYYGAIAEWFDIKLIEILAKKNKNWTFVLIGSTVGCDISEAQQLGNVIFTGEKPYSQLPEYLYRFDVCLIPFKIYSLTLATNPVKVYEYLAAGKPVVSSRLPELELIGENIISLASTPEEFSSAIATALKDNSLIKVNVRKEYAKKNTWEDRADQLQTLLKSEPIPKVSIVIVTYNNWVYTRQCLESVFTNNEYTNAEIIVVDNGSSDETRIQLARIKHAQLKVILSSENTGFAGGNKIGCQASTGEFIILLNNDTIVPKGWIRKFIKPFKERPEIGMMGPVSNSVGNDQMLDHVVGDPLNGPNQGWLADFYRNYNGRVRYTDKLGFFCVAIRREVYEKVGDLDTGYAVGMFEDDDYCERVTTNGYKIAIVEDAFVYHHGSASFKKLEDQKYREIFESNKLYFESKWAKKWTAPNPPLSIFSRLMDVESINLAIEAEKKKGLKVILILGAKEWSLEESRAKELSEKLSYKGALVISYVLTYHGNDIIGTRKIGPTLYVTNRVDLFEGITFDHVIYCGENEDSSRTFKGESHTLINKNQTDDFIDKFQFQ